jgi:hypothetical protein
VIWFGIKKPEPEAGSARNLEATPELSLQLGTTG